MRLCKTFVSAVADIGFQSSMYKALEGVEPTVTVCVSIFNGELTDMVSVSYSVSLQPQSATGKQLL